MRTRNTTSETKTYNHEYAVRRAVQFDKDVLFDLTIDDFTIYGCRVVEGKTATLSASPPARGRTGSTGGSSTSALVRTKQV